MCGLRERREIILGRWRDEVGFALVDCCMADVGAKGDESFLPLRVSY